MSCSCDATTMEGCPAWRDAAAQLGDDVGGPAADKVHRALWCILHPFQCRRDPKTGRPRLAIDDIVVLGVIAFAWLYFTREG